MPMEIDRVLYALAPRISVSSGTTLVEQLVDVAKDDASPTIGASVDKLRAVLERGRATQVDRVRAEANATAAGDLELDRRADRCIKAVKLRLEAWPLAGDDEPAQRAEQLLALLYPDGLRFTRATFGVQDAQMRRMLTEIHEPANASSLQALVGEPFIAAFEQVAQEYADMVKAMGRAAEPEVDQRSAVIALQKAIVQHSSRVLGELDD
ncbi:MAG: hypothetical protein AAGF11_55720, partial [Myxococcota bacterium]